MEFELTQGQKAEQASFHQFSVEEVAPYADEFDRQEYVSQDLIRNMARRGYLGALIPTTTGGRGMDIITYGLLNEEIGRSCSSLRSLITVHDMVAEAILKVGTSSQKAKWLPRLARGEIIGAFAVSEPDTGSDLSSLQSTARDVGNHYILDGVKRWITFGQIADLFLLLAQCNGKSTAFLVERNTPGLSIKPIIGLLGVRASMLAELTLDGCEVPRDNLIGRPGFGLLSAISTALSLGRYSVAWGCVGIAQSSLEAALRYTIKRKQFGVYLKEHQLIKQMISDMVTNIKAARLLCYQAGYRKSKSDPHEIMETFVAKYFASQTAMKAASDAVQIHGAYGCSSEYPVHRYFRDAKIMGIIEGSNQIQQLTIADYGYQELAASEQSFFEPSIGA